MENEKNIYIKQTTMRHATKFTEDEKAIRRFCVEIVFIF